MEKMNNIISNKNNDNNDIEYINNLFSSGDFDTELNNILNGNEDIIIKILIIYFK